MAKFSEFSKSFWHVSAGCLTNTNVALGFLRSSVATSLFVNLAVSERYMPQGARLLPEKPGCGKYQFSDSENTPHYKILLSSTNFYINLPLDTVTTNIIITLLYYIRMENVYLNTGRNSNLA